MKLNKGGFLPLSDHHEQLFESEDMLGLGKCREATRGSQAMLEALRCKRTSRRRSHSGCAAMYFRASPFLRYGITMKGLLSNTFAPRNSARDSVRSINCHYKIKCRVLATYEVH